MAIDFGGLFRQNQGPKTRNRNMQLTGGQAGNAHQVALHALPWYNRGNTAWAAFSRLCVESRAKILHAALYLYHGAQFCL